MEFSIGLKELLIGVALASLVYLLEILVFGRRARKSKADPAMREEIAALRQSLRQLGERVATLEWRLLGESQAVDSPPGAEIEIRRSTDASVQTPRANPVLVRERVTTQAMGAPSVHYDRPLHYARDGLSAAEIAARCGISLAEAELLVALHGPKDAPR